MSKNTIPFIAAAGCVIATVIAIVSSSEEPQKELAAIDMSLKDVFAEHFLIGVAINKSQFSGNTSVESQLVEKHFDTVSPENVMKWERIHPKLDTYNFGPSDEYVAYGEEHDMAIIGHTLVWHSQVPGWVFKHEDGSDLTREELLLRMESHINAVAGRYKGRLHGWDVVNEALNEDGTLRDSPWLRIIGEDYIAKAFEFAHKADPGAKLYYNDYNLEKKTKWQGAVSIAKDLQDRGILINGIGVQAHAKIDWPSMQMVEESILGIAAAGLEVHITELDVDVLPAAWNYSTADIAESAEIREGLNPYPTGLPKTAEEALTQRYTDLFNMYVKHSDVVERVTLWGVRDSNSWLNDWPVKGRTSYPLLFNREGKPKPSFVSVVEANR